MTRVSGQLIAVFNNLQQQFLTVNIKISKTINIDFGMVLWQFIQCRLCCSPIEVVFPRVHKSAYISDGGTELPDIVVCILELIGELGG